MNVKPKEEQSVDILVLLRKGNKTPMGGDTETLCGAETEGKAVQRLHGSGDSPQLLSPNPDSSVDANKHLLTGDGPNCLLRGPVSA